MISRLHGWHGNSLHGQVNVSRYRLCRLDPRSLTRARRISEGAR